MSYRVGIDVGGTFTDFLVLGEDGSRHRSQDEHDARRPVRRRRRRGSGRSPPSSGSSWPRFLAGTEVIVHGTTVTTNAVLTGAGAKTGLLATRGFRDALALRNGLRESPYDNRLQPPEPLVPRYLRLGIEGRLDFAGQEVMPLAVDEVARGVRAPSRRRASRRSRSASCTRPRNPDHERRARDLCRELLPEAYVTASSDLLPQVRLYDRTSTTVLNAYVGPIIERYLRALTARLGALGFGGVLLMMQSNGGVATPPEVSERAALSLLSGPASGPTAGLWQLAPHGIQDCITIDMGGTSFDAALVKDGAAARDDRWHRQPLADRAADDRHPHDRRGRRLDRARRRRAACSRSAPRAPALDPARRATAAAAS